MKLTPTKQTWWNKPRSGGMFRFMDWVLDSDQSFKVITTISTIMAMVVFGTLSTLMWLYSDGIFWKGLFTVFFVLAIWNFYKHIKYRRTLNKTQLEGISLRTIMEK